MSSFTILPLGPDPFTVLISIFFSPAILRASGEIFILPSAVSGCFATPAASTVSAEGPAAADDFSSPETAAVTDASTLTSPAVVCEGVSGTISSTPPI